MKYFSELLSQLIFCSSYKEKQKIIIKYLDKVDVLEGGYTVAVLTNRIKFKNITNKKIKDIIKKQIDQILFDLSYDYVGDLADTISLIWKKKKNKSIRKESLKKIISTLQNEKLDLEKYVINFLDNNGVQERWAFIKLILGGFRVGVSVNFIKNVLAEYGNKDVMHIEKVWNGLTPPFTDLMCWLKGEGEYPKVNISQTFHSLMLAHSINVNKDLEKINNNEYIAEYKWDGIRVQISISNNITKIYSRSGEDITHTFPEINLHGSELTVLDGELLAGKEFMPFSFSDLQKRLNKKKPSKKLLLSTPVFIRLYDILFFKNIDIREKSLVYRKTKLMHLYKTLKPNKFFDLSKEIQFTNLNSLKNIYNESKKIAYIEGLMIKKKTSFYVAGRKKGLWYKWKREPKFIDAILMYAQRGHGKRSSFYSDYTLGVISQNNVIVPVAKAYSGFTDDELIKLDKFVRNNTTNKYGPVREVKKILVIELAFDSMQFSNRHKSGISLRFPRFHRIRWDKPYDETLSLEQIKLEFMNS